VSGSISRRRFVLGLAILVLTAGPAVWSASACVTPLRPPGLVSTTVEFVSDGDTVRLRSPSGRRERTRLIGLDAPEAHANEKLERDVGRTGRDRETMLALGRRASAFVRRLLPVGAAIEVEQDLRARDQHSRLLD
jgi:micrococcal nuclease